MLWRYRWLALILSAAICALGWVHVVSLPNTYEVNAKVFVDTRSMLRPLLKGLAVENTMLSDSAMLMKRTLLTRPNLEDVARRTDLDLSAETPRQFEALIVSLADRIRLSGTSRDNVYEIEFEDTNAERAKKVVDELLNTFLETALGSTRTDTEVTQQFLDEQIAEYEQRLIEAEERLKSFKQRNIGLMPGAETNYFQRLESTKLKLNEAELLLSEARSRRDKLRSRLSSVRQSSETTVQDNNLLAMSRYTERIDGLQNQLDQLLLQFTERHPDVVSLTAKLAELETKREEELKEIAQELEANAESAGVLQSEAVVQTRLAVAESEAEVAALEARVKEYAKQLEVLNQQVDTIPEVEAELARLNRDYGLNKKQFEELLQRRESARLSEEVDQQAEDVKLKVIEPPRVPLAPSGPNRVMFFTAVFFAALGAGGALAFVLSQVQPRFYTAEELKEFSQLPIVGTVSYRSSTRYRSERRMELAVFSLIFMLLAGAYGGLIVLEKSRFDLHGKFQAIVGNEV